MENTIQHIRQYCLSWLISYWNWSEEDAVDFFAYIRPQIVRSLHTYFFDGRSFLRYLRRLIRFQVKTYNCTKKTEQLRQEDLFSALQYDYQISQDGIRRHIGIHDHVWPESEEPITISDSDDMAESLYCHEPPEYLSTGQKRETEVDFEAARQAIQNLTPEHKRLVLRALQKTENLNDAAIAQLSKSTGIPPLYLLAFRQLSFAKIEHRIQQRNIIRDRQTRKFMRLYFGHENPAVKDNVRNYLARSRKVIQHMRISPSHTELSEITGLPKGSIGSNLYSQNHRSSAG